MRLGVINWGRHWNFGRGDCVKRDNSVIWFFGLFSSFLFGADIGRGEVLKGQYRQMIFWPILVDRTQFFLPPGECAKRAYVPSPIERGFLI